MICVDTSVAVKWAVEERESDLALALRQAVVDTGDEFIVPALFFAELSNALYRAVRENKAPQDEVDYQLGMLSLAVHSNAPGDLSRRALEIAVELNLPATYDAHYLTIGELYECDVWTADERFHRAAGRRYPNLHLLAEFTLRTQ